MLVIWPRRDPMKTVATLTDHHVDVCRLTAGGALNSTELGTTYMITSIGTTLAKKVSRQMEMTACYRELYVTSFKYLNTIRPSLTVSSASMPHLFNISLPFCIIY